MYTNDEIDVIEKEMSDILHNEASQEAKKEEIASVIERLIKELEGV